MSAINYSIREIHNRIPSKILKSIFGSVPGFNCSYNPTTIDDQIRNRIIYGRVMTDMNIVGGREKFLRPNDGEVLHSGSDGTSYHYNEKYMHGLDIIAVHYHMYGNPPIGEIWTLGASGAGGVDGNLNMPLGTSGFSQKKESDGCKDKNSEELLKKLEGVGVPKMEGFTGRVVMNLISKNTILTSVPLHGGYFKVTISDDPEMNQVPPRSYRAFARLVELATLAYIYRESVLELEQAEIYQGVSMMGAKNWVAEKADSEELYQEQLTKWAKIAFMHDRGAYARFIRAKISPEEYM